MRYFYVYSMLFVIYIIKPAAYVLNLIQHWNEWDEFIKELALQNVRLNKLAPLIA